LATCARSSWILSPIETPPASQARATAYQGLRRAARVLPITRIARRSLSKIKGGAPAAALP